MKKRNLLFTFLISFIVLISNVKAEDLTCIYADGISQKPIKLEQNSNGQRTIYENTKEETDSNSANWSVIPSNKISIDFTLGQYYFKNDGTIQEFPRYWNNDTETLNACPYCLNYKPKKYEFQFKDNVDKAGNIKTDCKAGWTKLVDLSSEKVLDNQEWLAECVYKSTNGEKLNVNFNDEYIAAFDTKYSSNKSINSDEFYDIVKKDLVLVTIENKISLSLMLSNYKYNNRCPASVYKGLSTSGANIVRYKLTYSTISSDIPSASSTTIYTLDDNETKYIKPDDNKSGNQQPELQCGLFSQDLIDLINDVMKWVRIIVPIMLICFGIIDFTKATFSGKEEDMSKCKQKFIKRLIAAILVFFVPSVVELILNLANDVWSWISPETCIK